MSQDLIPITQLVLPIPDDINDFVWQQSRSARSGTVQWRIYLNQIAECVLLPYLQEDFPDVAPGFNQATLWDIWQSINGTVLVINQKRLLLLPDQAIDQDELVIPAAWVDRPDWAVDYIMPVRVDPDEQWVHYWGYTTQQILKAKGRYAHADSAYYLDAHCLFSDVSALWIVQQLNPLEVTQTNELIEARMALAAQAISNMATDMVTDVGTRTSDPTVQLQQWLQNVFTTGWQAIEDFFDQDTELALAFRQVLTPTAPAAPTTPTVRRVKALHLPDRLLLLLLTIEPQADSRLRVQVQLRSAEVLPPQVADRPEGLEGLSRLTIPADLTLELLSSRGEVVQSVQARQADNAIQLSRFRSAPGTEFTIQVRLAGNLPAFTFTESFVV
jgi:Protein of unknown function (DUF1822)